MNPLEDLDLAELARQVGDDSRLPADVVSAGREIVWRKASRDLEFFLLNFWHVETVKEGYALMNPRDYQLDEIRVMAEAMRRDRIREDRLKARQVGYTTVAAGVAFHSAYFHNHRPWLIASQGQTEAQDTLGLKVKHPFSMLPRWMKERGPKQLDDSKERLTLDNGSVIYSVTSTSSAGRSKAVFGVILDEFAFVDGGEDLLAALDPLCYGPMFVFSTADGIGNAFHATWMESRRSDSEWNALSREMRPDAKWNGTFQPWYVVPGRDQKWYDRELRKARGREHLFYQEYPATPEEAFIKSGRTALPVDILEDEQCWCEPEWRIDLTRVDLDAQTIPLHAIIEEGSDPTPHELLIWQLPTVERDPNTNQLVRPPSYVVATDTAEGLEHGDKTSIAVYNANTLEVVATYSGFYPLEILGQLLEWLGYFYHTALQIPERNNHGMVPIVYLQTVRYPRIWRMDQPGQRRPGRRNDRLGWATTPATKPRMVYAMVSAIRDGRILLHDRRFFEEALTFIADNKGLFGASQGNHDDHILAHLFGLMACDNIGQYPLVWQDPVSKRITYGDLDRLDAMSARRKNPRREVPIGQSGAPPKGTTLSFFLDS